MHIDSIEPVRPPILLTETDAEALSDLALARSNRAKLASRMLLGELERADVCAAGELPDDVITIMSRVNFTNEATGAAHEVQLVYPNLADSAQHRISILTPVGAGLIGLRVGQSIDWPNRAGKLRRLKIVGVTRIAEPASA